MEKLKYKLIYLHNGLVITPEMSKYTDEDLEDEYGLRYITSLDFNSKSDLLKFLENELPE